MSAAPRSGHTHALAVVWVVPVLVGLLLLRIVTSSVSIGGDATAPISRGVAVPLDVRFTNSYDFPVSVRGLWVSVQAVKMPNASGARPCTVADFSVQQISTKVAITLAAHSTSRLSNHHLPATMWPRVAIRPRAGNEDACQGASLTLAYTATRTPMIS